MIFDTIPVQPLETNCYLIGDENDRVCALVDPGGSPERVLDMVRRSGLTPAMILLTHGHFDHVGAIPALSQEYPALPVYCHGRELCEPDNWIRRYWLPHQGKNQRTYGEGDALALGSLTLQVLHTPGHSAGSVVILAGEYMLSGDTLFAGSCGRCDLPGGSEEEMLRSLARLGGLTKNYRVCPGHGPLSTLDHERAHNPYMMEALSR